VCLKQFLGRMVAAPSKTMIGWVLGDWGSLLSMSEWRGSIPFHHKERVIYSRGHGRRVDEPQPRTDGVRLQPDKLSTVGACAYLNGRRVVAVRVDAFLSRKGNQVHKGGSSRSILWKRDQYFNNIWFFREETLKRDQYFNNSWKSTWFIRHVCSTGKQ
jgi:hypothetical protein